MDIASTSPMIAIAIAPLNTSLIEPRLNCTILNGGNEEGILPVSLTPFWSKAKIIIKIMGMIIPIKAPGRFLLIFLQINIIATVITPSPSAYKLVWLRWVIQ